MIKKAITAVLFLVCCSSARAQYGFPSFADLAEEVMPTVVNISTLQETEKISLGPDEEEDGETAAAEFDDEAEKSEARQALGSGFIIDEQGYILTNYHVIENASAINVVLSDNTEVEADIIGGDEKTDLALIKIEPPFVLKKVEFGNSDELRVGDWVLSVGNPFGLGGSVSAGIVSAKSRDIAAGQYDNFIQTDASINQGSSGGPMFNMKGEVIGINTALFSTTGASMGVGFAIPINTAGWIAGQLEQNGKVKRGWIGVRIKQNSRETARSLNLNDNQGVIISAINENSPAEKAGLTVGDVILSLGEKEIKNSKDFSRMIAESKIGEDVTLIVWRDGKIKTVDVRVVEMPAMPVSLNLSGEEKSSNNDKISYNTGLKLQEITPQIIEEFELMPSTLGLVVNGVEANSDAARQGIKRGDVILKIDKKDVLTLDAAWEYIKEAKQENDRPIMLTITDQNQEAMAVSIKLKKHE
ncbi:MAG: Do family serine endopeptidase [Alphaproteobacteria bacterium]|nr:Do family serine endopeptidase [Alphaproteobacteria bacterium]